MADLQTGAMIASVILQASRPDAVSQPQDTPFLYTFIAFKRHQPFRPSSSGFSRHKSALYTAPVQLPGV